MLTDENLPQELSAAFRQQIDPIMQTAIEPGPVLRQALRYRRRRAATRAGSVLAAVAAITASLVIVVEKPASGPVAATSPAGVLLAARVITAPPATAAASGLPPFYLVVDHNQPVAVVRDSATGQIVSTISLPTAADPKETQVTATGDDRTFILALAVVGGTQLWRLQITATGQPAGLTQLTVPPLPAQDTADSIAATPDGTQLAVAIQVDSGQGEIAVITLATGSERTWTTPRDGIPEDLSWDATGRTLGYFWTGEDATANGLWLLDTHAPGSTLLSGQPLLAQTVGPDVVQDALLAPDARTIIASVTYDGTTRVSRGTVVGGIVEVSARTGRPLQTLLAEHAAYSSNGGWYVTSCALPSIDSTGNHLLVSCDQFGRLDRGRFTPLPGSAPQTVVATGW